MQYKWLENLIMATFAADMSSMENVLVQGLSSRDDNAFQELFRLFGQRIFRTAMKILKEEESAKDALQETMINIQFQDTLCLS